MKNLIAKLEAKGTVNTHYFNGYGFTNKTKQVKEALEAKGLIKGVDFEIKQVFENNSRTKIVLC
jgi:hypothetical protein